MFLTLNQGLHDLKAATLQCQEVPSFKCSWTTLHIWQNKFSHEVKFPLALHKGLPILLIVQNKKSREGFFNSLSSAQSKRYGLWSNGCFGRFNKSYHFRIRAEDIRCIFSSIQFSRSVVSDSLQPHELQHARPPCPSPIPRVYRTRVHRVSDAIQPSLPLLSPSPPVPNPSQHQSLFQWVNSSHEVAKILEFQL